MRRLLQVDVVPSIGDLRQAHPGSGLDHAQGDIARHAVFCTNDQRRRAGERGPPNAGLSLWT